MEVQQKRRFFSVLVCKSGADYCLENLSRILSNQYFVFGEDTVQRGPYKEVKAGDILLLSYNNSYVAYASAKGIRKSKDDHWNEIIDIDIWIQNDASNIEKGIGTYGIGWQTLSGSRSVVKEVKAPWALGKLKEINSGDSLYKIIKNEFANMKEQEQISQLQDLLLGLKPQIILQGPPGTGKTRLAKLLAKQLSDGVQIPNPKEVIDDFFREFDPEEEFAINQNMKVAALLNEFYKRFPKENLDTLSLEDYCTGRGNRDNFCWWLENGLKLLNTYSPGNSTHYLIYWKNETQEYIKSGSLIKNDSDEEAIRRVSQMLSDLVNHNDPVNDSISFGKSLQLKILNSYYPDEYFPINSNKSLDVALSLCGLYEKSLNIFEKNKKLMGFFKQKRDELNPKVSAIDFMQFLFSKFNLKEGILYNGQELVITKGDYKIVQFHPSYSYEDFVRGITAELQKEGIAYKTENKVLLEFAQKAIDNPSGKYVLVIDEINRANLPTVLGELIYALEYRYDENNPEETSVESIYEYKHEENTEPSRVLRLPKNLYIIGTMNTADRSVGHIDYAIRRRFAFVNIFPNEEVIELLRAKELFKEMKKLFERKDGISLLASDFEPDDVMPGHSYFLAENNDQLRLKLKFEILPLLNEYVRDGILMNAAKEKIKALGADFTI